MKQSLLSSCMAATLVVGIQGAHACTGIMIEGKDSTVVRVRTVEWGPIDLSPIQT